MSDELCRFKEEEEEGEGEGGEEEEEEAAFSYFKHTNS